MVKPPGQSNSYCLYCYAGVPPDVLENGRDAHSVYWCKSCDTKLLDELTFTGDEVEIPVGVSFPPGLREVHQEQNVLPENQPCEVNVFWNGRQWSIVICGHHSLGDRSVTEYALKLLSNDSISH